MTTALLDRPHGFVPDIDDNLTRRRLLSGIGALGLSITLAGCADDDETGASAPAPAASPSPTGPFPVRIDHKFGSMEIAAEPRRVLSLGFTDQDAILALGVVPIAVRFFTGDSSGAVFPWAEDAAGGANPEVLTMTSGELDYEKIAALDPDLIIAVYSGITAKEYDTLTRFAPTLAQSGDYPDFAVPWEEMTRAVGTALGRRDRAEELIEAVASRFESARGAHPELQGRSMVLAGAPGDGTYTFFASDNRRSLVFTDLGLVVPEEFDEIAGEEFSGTISTERVKLLDTDVLIWHQYGEDGPATVGQDELLQTLDAAAEGRMVFLEDDVRAASVFSSVLSLPFLLDRVVPALAAAVDGDPDTTADPAAELSPSPAPSATPTS